METESTMQAILHSRYGTPDVLQFGAIDRPVPGDDDVLVRVHAAAASVGDHHVVTGKPYVIRLSLGGLRRPKHPVVGQAMAGVVEAIGKNVTTCRPGDEVYGDATGTFAEYVVVPAKRIAPKPGNLSFEEAACTPWGVAALQALRDKAKLQPRQRVLINGASGGVGTWAVQIAKAMGAHVTAVCSTRNVELVRGLGADEVIDYSRQDFTHGGRRFDVVFDTVGNHSVAALRGVLEPKGVLVACSGGSSGTAWVLRMLWMMVAGRFTSHKLVTLITAPNRDDLLAMTALVEAGKGRPVIERRYPLADVASALRHVGAGHTRGQIAITVAG